ncbi:MAG: ATP-binding protein [Armatimonadota bacterium]
MIKTAKKTNLKITVKVDNNHPFVFLSGEADSSNIKELVSILNELAAKYPGSVTLDFSGVDSLEVCALEPFAQGANVYREKNRQVHIKDASSKVKEVFEKTLLSDLFCDDINNSANCDHHSNSTPWELDVFCLPYSINCSKEARHRIANIVKTVGFDDADCQDIVLAVGEAVANAVKHGKPADGNGKITVSCFATPDKVAISVSDDGPGIPVDKLNKKIDPERPILDESGRGLFCIKSVMDEVSISVDSGTTLRMIKYKTAH